MKGRKPKPTKLKVLQGTSRPDRVNPNEPTPNPEIPSAPEHLSRYALMEWGRITEELHRLGLVSSIDRAALSAYCQTYARWREAEEQLIGKDGTPTLVTETANGTIIQHPLVGVANKALELMHKFLVEFGMTPSSRSRVPAKEEKPKKSKWAV